MRGNSARLPQMLEAAWIWRRAKLSATFFVPDQPNRATQVFGFDCLAYRGCRASAAGDIIGVQVILHYLTTRAFYTLY